MMTASVVRARLAATVSLVALCLATPTLAEQAQEQTATIDDIIVTAQKREESIQSVPIAVSAFSAEKLDAMNIEGGSELLRGIPNVTFAKSNFSMYNFSIRGIGTKAVSSSSDPAVAVSFNNSPMIRNRLFESEYLDVSRVEVLRGPQGTLYGRNATAGVVNMIPNLARPDFDAMMKVEGGNYGSMRGQVMANIPLSDTLWVRGAASLTKRDGFDYNTYTEEHTNGRDLNTVRLSAVWSPNDVFDANLIWERFSEDDDRLRTGKQLCTRDGGPSNIGTYSITDPSIRGKFSQGCSASSLYSDSAYDTPNATGMPQILVLANLMSLGFDRATLAGRRDVSAITPGTDPFAGVKQSRNLREISTEYGPKFNAENNILQLNMNYRSNSGLNIVSQTLYTTDEYYSTQDYNRFVSNPIFNDSNGLFSIRRLPILGSEISPGGFYTDPQLGASNRMVSADVSSSSNRQFSQEIRLAADINDNLKYSLGANYLNFKTEDNYYVFNNTFSMLAEYFYGADSSKSPALVPGRCKDSSFIECVYVDYTSLANLAGDGHNYFRSKNVVSSESAALFGEVYWSVNDRFNLTFGARYTHDTKETTPYPSQLLLGYSDIFGGISTGGTVARGLVADPKVKLDWSALTGRVVADWKPTDEVTVYASLARGYKGGGMNPPRAGIDPSVVQYQPLPDRFDPEYVNAFEIGAKSDLLDNRLRLNLTAFYYDYKDYQVSQIVDRISLNENFDVVSYGLELESIWKPNHWFQMDLNLGYLNTSVADGARSVDVMNRTQGNEDWVLVRPWVQVPSNCIAPKSLVESVMTHPEVSEYWMTALSALCGGSARVGSFDPKFPSPLSYYDMLGVSYNPLTDAPNGGRGFDADLSGNSLPNAPNFTGNIGMQFNGAVGNWDWRARADYYYQGASYFRIYNTEYDRIRSWDNLNLSVEIGDERRGISASIYVKNVFDDAPIVDAFTNSDDSMLTTNVFTLDPRIVGFNLKKNF